MPPLKHKQTGLSLVELMVALVVGLILVAGVIELFTNNRQVYRMQDAQSRLQESGRYAMQFLTDSIEKAGYLGCATRSDVILNNTLNGSSTFLWDFSRPLEGNEASGNNQWTPTLDASITSALGGSDTITVRTVDSPEMRVDIHPASSPPGESAIVVHSGTHLRQGDIVLAHNCVAAAVFQITSSDAQAHGGTLAHAAGGASNPGNATAALGYHFGDGWINRLSTNSFYIRNNPAGIPSLYRKTFNQAAEELVEGIEQMQITYGVDTTGDGSADEYRAADTVGNWNNVVSVRISLLAVSLQDNLTVDGPQGYFFNGQQVAPEEVGDRRLRRVFSRTIALRNRVL